MASSQLDHHQFVVVPPCDPFLLSSPNMQNPSHVVFQEEYKLDQNYFTSLDPHQTWISAAAHQHQEQKQEQEQINYFTTISTPLLSNSNDTLDYISYSRCSSLDLSQIHQLSNSSLLGHPYPVWSLTNPETEADTGLQMSGDKYIDLSSCVHGIVGDKVIIPSDTSCQEMESLLEYVHPTTFPPLHDRMDGLMSTLLSSPQPPELSCCSSSMLSSTQLILQPQLWSCPPANPNFVAHQESALYSK